MRGVSSAQNVQQSRGRANGPNSGENLSFINTVTCKFDSVRRVAARLGMKESYDNWDIYWTDTSITVDRCKEMKRYQRINHFPGMFEICRKDQLARNLNRLQKLHPTEFHFFPRTWCLRSEIAEVLEHAKTNKNDVYIIKPNIGCQGRGICITNNVNRLKRCGDVICQVYLQKPLLIDGYKFDLRVYVLITSCDPLRIFVYNEGLARFATAKYCRPDSFNAANQFMHLTNYSVNKHSQAYLVGDDGSKRRLSSINQWFVSNHYDLKKIWKDVDDAIIKTVIASLPTVRHEYHVAFPHGSPYACFEILGFDFIFDCQTRPYILEVNHSPSLQTDTEIDLEIKDALLQDVFNILNLQTTNRVDILALERKQAWERLFSVTRQGNILSRERAKNQMISKQQADWENSHLGNFRKVYPAKGTSYYEQFLCVQSSLFSGTCSSRAKGTTSSVKYKTTRFKLHKMLKLPSCPSLVKLETIQSQTNNQNRRSKTANAKSTFTFNPTTKIEESEEKERLARMKRRDSLVQSYGMFEKVFENLRNAGLLKSSDKEIVRQIPADAGECKRGIQTKIDIGDALETIAKTMEPSWAKTPFKFDLKPQSFQPTMINEYEETERIQSREKREFLLESIGIHKIVHDYFKQSGLLKIEEKIKKKTGHQERAKPTSSRNERNSSKTKNLDKASVKTKPLKPNLSKMGNPNRPKRMHQAIVQLHTLIEFWKERQKSMEQNRRPKVDSPENWGTPEEFPEVIKIQSELSLNVP